MKIYLVSVLSLLALVCCDTYAAEGRNSLRSDYGLWAVHTFVSFAFGKANDQITLKQASSLIPGIQVVDFDAKENVWTIVAGSKMYKAKRGKRLHIVECRAGDGDTFTVQYNSALREGRVHNLPLKN